MGSQRIGHDWATEQQHSVNKLNKQADNIQLCCTPFPIWNQSIVSCLVLTVASWPEYRFLRRQARWSCIPMCLRISHSFLWSTQSKALVQLINRGKCIFWNSVAFSMIKWMSAIWFLIPLPCLTQWSYEPYLVRPPNTDRSWWRILTKCGPLENGLASHFNILALRTTWKDKKHYY